MLFQILYNAVYRFIHSKLEVDWRLTNNNKNKVQTRETKKYIWRIVVKKVLVSMSQNSSGSLLGIHKLIL